MFLPFLYSVVYRLARNPVSVRSTHGVSFTHIDFPAPNQRDEPKPAPTVKERERYENREARLSPMKEAEAKTPAFVYILN